MLGTQLTPQLLPQFTLAWQVVSGGVKVVGSQLHHSQLAMWANYDKNYGESCVLSITSHLSAFV